MWLHNNFTTVVLEWHMATERHVLYTIALPENTRNIEYAPVVTLCEAEEFEGEEELKGADENAADVEDERKARYRQRNVLNRFETRAEILGNRWAFLFLVVVQTVQEMRVKKRKREWRQRYERQTD